MGPTVRERSEERVRISGQIDCQRCREVVSKLEQAEIDFHRRTSLATPDAYSRVMRGTSSLYEWTPASIDAALEQYQLAMNADPDFAPAYAMASYCYVQRQSFGGLLDRSKEAAEGVSLAWRAAELGKNNSHALTRAAHGISALALDISGGMSLVEQAIALNPNFAAAWYVRGWLQVFHGDAAGALADLDHARRLSPYDRLVFKINAAMAYAHFFAGRYDDASQFALSANPGTSELHDRAAGCRGKRCGGRTKVNCKAARGKNDEA